MKDNEILNNFVNCTVGTLVRLRSGGGLDKWPMPKYSINECEIYSSPYLIRYFLDYTKELEKKGYSEKEIAYLFKYPSIIARLAFTLKYKHLLHASYEEQIEATLRMAKYLLEFNKKVFYTGTNRKNILWSDKYLQQRLKEVSLINLSISPQKKKYYKLISQIDGKLLLYTELVHSDFHNLGHEFHGPYDSGKEELIVKEFHDLKPDYWKFAKSFPYENITIFELYDKGKIKVSIDIHNRIYTSKPIAWHVTKFCLVANGKRMVGLNDLQKISKSLDKILRKGIKEKTSLDKRGVITKLAEKNFYLIKSLAQELGKEWHPPKEVYQKIKKLYLNKKEKAFLQLLSQLKGDRMAYKLRYDPRVPIKLSRK